MFGRPGMRKGSLCACLLRAGMLAEPPWGDHDVPWPVRVEIHCFRYRLTQPMYTVFGPLEARPALVLRVEDDEGASGWGEVWCNFPQPGAEYRARLAALV